MKLGVFLPIGNNGWLISEAAPQYKPSFALNKAIVQKAEGYGLDFALSMIKLHGFGGKTEFWDYNLESFTLMAGLAAVTSRITAAGPGAALSAVVSTSGIIRELVLAQMYDDALREVVGRMWDMALQIEDGNVSQAELALRQAQDALRQALDDIRSESVEGGRIVRRYIQDRTVIEDTESTVDLLAELAEGGTALELAVGAAPLVDGRPHVTEARVRDTIQRRTLLYDKSGEEHYNLISALHKSMRNSDPDAAVYWVARMLEAGEDPLYVARRLIRFASEDVGNADPQALTVAVAAKARMDGFVRGVARYQKADAPVRPTAPAPIWTHGAAALRHYGGTKTPVFVVPSLVNRATVLDLSADRSLLSANSARSQQDCLPNV